MTFARSNFGRCFGLSSWCFSAALAAVAVPGTMLRAQCPAGWVTGVGNGGANAAVRSLAAYPNGDVIAGGSFSMMGTLPTANKIARYSYATGTWSSLGTGTNGNIVHSIAVLPDGDVLAGGNFNSIGGVTTRQLARYDFDTQVWSSMGYGNNGGQVNAILVLPPSLGGDILIGGNFFRVAGMLVEHCARYNVSTGTWSSMGSNMGSTGDTVTSFALAPDGTVIVGGSFLNAGTSGALRIARYNPANGAWTALGSGMNSTVAGVTVLPNGHVIAGGYFTTAGGVGANRAARYNPATGVWSPLGVTGLTGEFEFANAVALLPSGDVVIGGSFTVAGGVGASRIARYNPATDTFAAMGFGVNNDVNSMTVLTTGDVVAGGVFTSAGGVGVARIAQYSFGASAPIVTDEPDSAEACVGNLATFGVAASGASPITHTWQWQPAGTSTPWVNLSTGINNDIGGTPVLDAENVGTPTLGLRPLAGYVNFPPRSLRCVITNTCGSVTSNAEVLGIPPTCCPSDLDDGTGTGSPDGGVDINDLLFFLEKFELGDAAADVDDDGDPAVGNPDGGTDINDLLFFLAHFEIGC